ncbi:MAG: 4Fe-4S binding protein [Cellulomonas sp.]|nr:4Fe-4S binding protein [Cellulomonas sp.]
MVRASECLAALPASAYLELVAAGVAGVTVRLDGCESPAEVDGRIAEANRLLAACGRTDRVVTVGADPGTSRRAVHDPHALPVGRRSLLLLRGASVAGPVAERAGSERERMLGALRRLTTGLAPASAEARSTGRAADLADLEAPSAVLSVVGCSGCGVCVRACPTDALRLHKSRGSADLAVEHLSLRQMPAACVDCGECLRLCPEQAITTRGRHSWAELLAGMPQFLVARDARACTRCGGALVAVDDDDSLCQVCAYRWRHPFESMIPAAARVSLAASAGSVAVPAHDAVGRLATAAADAPGVLGVSVSDRVGTV